MHTRRSSAAACNGASTAASASSSRLIKLASSAVAASPEVRSVSLRRSKAARVSVIERSASRFLPTQGGHSGSVSLSRVSYLRV